jgi:superoxide dismutase, Cu-Zn family
MTYLVSIAASALLLAGGFAFAADTPQQRAATPVRLAQAAAKQTPPVAQTATAELKSADGKDVGKVTLTQTRSGVRLQLALNGLPPGEHAFHVHAVGKCEPPFTSAGPHFNPEQKKHGKDNPEGHHAGDMDNITVPASGKANLTVVDKDITLEKGKPNSVFQDAGTALVIHAGKDDYKSDPAGNAGDRIACGVITEAKAAGTR